MSSRPSRTTRWRSSSTWSSRGLSDLMWQQCGRMALAERAARARPLQARFTASGASVKRLSLVDCAMTALLDAQLWRRGLVAAAHWLRSRGWYVLMAESIALAQPVAPGTVNIGVSEFWAMTARFEGPRMTEWRLPLFHRLCSRRCQSCAIKTWLRGHNDFIPFPFPHSEGSVPVGPAGLWMSLAGVSRP